MPRRINPNKFRRIGVFLISPPGKKSGPFRDPCLNFLDLMMCEEGIFQVLHSFLVSSMQLFHTLKRQCAFKPQSSYIFSGEGFYMWFFSLFCWKFNLKPLWVCDPKGQKTLVLYLYIDSLIL